MRKEGWKYKKLGEVCSFMGGYTPPKDEITDSGYPYFKVAEMNHIRNTKYMIQTDNYVKNPKKIYPKGSIIFPKNGGAIYTEKKRILIQDSVIDLNTEAIIPNPNVVLLPYLYHLLAYIKISSFDNGGGLPSINIKKMSEYIIPVPPLAEQQAIVSRLDTFSEHCRKLEQNYRDTLTLCDDLKQALLREVFE